MKRDAIPMKLRRKALIEAGHRCAIPTCKQTSTNVAHIIRYNRVRSHTFDNMIVLCANCHARYDKGEIDRKSMKQYKANLSIINDRYSDFEQRILQYFIDHPDEEEIQLSLSGNNDIQIMNLVRDGYLEFVRGLRSSFSVGTDPDKIYRLTNKGGDFIKKWSGPYNIG